MGFPGSAAWKESWPGFDPWFERAPGEGNS